MKNKILVSGNNTTFIVDFIRHTETFFDSISTTTYWKDIMGHFKYFCPDAFVIFVDPGMKEILPRLRKLKDDEVYNGAGIFLICDSDIFENPETVLTLKLVANMIIRRPISVDNLILTITNYFDKLKEEKEKTKTVEGLRNLASAIDSAETAKETENKEEKEKSAAQPVKETRRKKILVVDDDRLILKMLKTALSDKYDVITMVNGVVAERYLEKEYVDLVVLDYEMPIETGADVFRKIKNNPKISRTPVCFLTGVSERNKIMELMSLKPHGYLLKPIDMDVLLSTISNLID